MPEKNDLDSKITSLIYGVRVYVTQEFPTRQALIKLPPDEQIEVACGRYRFWVLKHAQELAEQPDAGYTALMVLLSYFDMIAQLSGVIGKPDVRAEEGLKLVFPELVKEPQIVDEIVMRFRNPLAHMGATRDHVILIELYDEPLVWGTFKGVPNVIVINPRLWVKQIIQHFDQFEANLRNPDSKYDQLRKDFLNRIANPA